MRRLAFLVAAIVLGTLAPAVALDWPHRTVTMVVPFAAGSTPDVVARLVAERLQARLGQPFVIENKPGASGNVGTGSVAKAVPDGYTIGVSIVGPLTLNTLLFKSLPYDPQTEIAPISVLATQPTLLVTSRQLGAKSTADLVALLKKDATTLNYGSIGAGSLSQLAVEMIARESGGGRPTHIPFTSSPAVLTALLRNDVQMAVLAAASVVQQGRAGDIDLLAVTAATRSPLLPDLPTLAEAGITGVETDTWIGLIAPAKTDPAILTKLEQEARAILAEPELGEKLKLQYMVPSGSTSQQFRELLTAEMNRWGPVIKANGIKIGP